MLNSLITYGTGLLHVNFRAEQDCWTAGLLRRCRQCRDQRSHFLSFTLMAAMSRDVEV